MSIIDEFMAQESASGIVLIFATILALLCSNTPLSSIYTAFLHLHLAISIGDLRLDMALYHWVNDGLMAIFFLLIGLEVKREVVEGHLSSLRQIILPGIAAVGGMVVPAAIYLLFNYNDPITANGWAIPTATDIAFA
ncbi:MAG: Na+/H+ antiporter NhaA, partial [Mariprofundales bacterium]|nr:Na+/H+ antiporter NhaA [Mariprofundales bacterium]